MKALLYSGITHRFSLFSTHIFHKTYKTRPIRVRFAPSPTGYLHLGGLRTALYNYLFALSNNGKMILRIEDTDQARKVEGAVDALTENLEWAGIHFHEGPKTGGDYGPYIQSERSHIYQEHVAKLLANGSAYRCFCTERRVQLLRREATRAGLRPGYDNRCRHLNARQVEEKLADGIKYCVRLKLTSDCQSFEDLIFGGVAHDASGEGDPVLMKADGLPTYHLANVVDDHLMGVSHVLRGVEWQISTTKHLLLYKAFGWDPPLFGHLPLIVNPDGTKLSKRQGDVNVKDYENRGIFPLALINFLTLSGGGFDHVPGAGVRLHAVEELAEQFDIGKVNSHPSRLNPDLLNECNRLELVRRLKDETTTNELIDSLSLLIRQHYEGEQLHTDRNHLTNVLRWSTSRISSLSELTTSKYAFLWILPKSSASISDSGHAESLNRLRLLLEVVPSESFVETRLRDLLKTFAKDDGVKFTELMKVLRAALSGLAEGPKVAEMMELLGKDVVLQRLSEAVIGKGKES